MRCVFAMFLVILLAACGPTEPVAQDRSSKDNEVSLYRAEYNTRIIGVESALATLEAELLGFIKAMKSAEVHDNSYTRHLVVGANGKQAFLKLSVAVASTQGSVVRFVGDRACDPGRAFAPVLVNLAGTLGGFERSLEDTGGSADEWYFLPGALDEARRLYNQVQVVRATFRASPPDSACKK